MTHDIIKQITDGRTDLGLDFGAAARLDRHLAQLARSVFTHGLGSRLSSARGCSSAGLCLHRRARHKRHGPPRWRATSASVTPGQCGGGQCPQAPIHQRQQLPCRRRIAGLDLRQDAGDVGHRATVRRENRPYNTVAATALDQESPVSPPNRDLVTAVDAIAEAPSDFRPIRRSAANRNIPSYTGEFLRIPKLSKTLLISR